MLLNPQLHLDFISLRNKPKAGFTLIELSIVLVIIGLIVGGVITGVDLINSAAVNAQITQIAKYNTAVRAFQSKYECLPGDCANAATYNFSARGSNTGQGDGNGIIEGYGTGLALCPNNHCGYLEATGESGVFWVDLSSAGMIDGRFNTASATSPPGSNITGSTINNYFPQAKISNNNSVMVWSGGPAINGASCGSGDTFNYFGISVIEHVAEPSGALYGNAGMSVSQAYNMDKKTDDAMPQSGSVQAMYINFNTTDQGSVAWSAGAAGFGAESGSPNYSSSTTATAASSTTCYDNANTAGYKQSYSMGQNKGNGLNCAVSIKFQ